MRRWWLVLFCLFGFRIDAFGQQEENLVSRVLSRNGRSVQVDQGRETHVEPGDLVWFRPLGEAPVRGVVQSVETRTAWVLLQGTEDAIQAGTPAEITITPNPATSDKPEAWLREKGTDLPSTPPVWQTDSFPRESGTPLLAEIPRLEQERLPTSWSGQSYLLFDIIRDRETVSRTSIFGRAGTDLYGEDLHGSDGSLRLSFDMDLRSYSEGDLTDRNSAIRLERLSYARPLARNHPLHWQVGRFLPSEFPEFGVLDGAELVFRRGDGHRFGSSVGYLPRPGQEYRTGEDLQIAATYQGMLGKERQYRWGLGFQKSWHEGTPDRDLAILKVHYLPSAAFSWTNSAWIDFYGSSDTSKPSGPEISLWTSHLNWNRRNSGSSLGFRHWRLPQTDRFGEAQDLLQESFQARTSRLDASSWMRIYDRLRLTGRADYWKSEEESGKGGDLRLDFDALFGTGSRTWANLYFQEGGQNTVGGLRLGQSLRFASTLLSLRWDGARYRPVDGDGTLAQQDLRLGWDYRSASAWTLSLDLGRRFGDSQDTHSASLYLQRSF